MGTPAFALPGLQALLEAPNFEIVGVFTQTDKPVGRKQAVLSPPVKELPQKNNLKVFQPEKIKDETENIKQLQPDLIVVIAYGKVLPPEILATPRQGCVNVHASLLPKYRGAACLNAPIINGDAETGLTIMKMEAGLDTGPILRQAVIKLDGSETLEQLHDALAKKSREILITVLRDWLAGKIVPQAQDDAQASYVKALTKSDGKLDWLETAEKIERLIRGLNPWPGTFSKVNGRILKILAVEHQVYKINKYPIGTIFQEDSTLLIQCGQNSLAILKLQLEGKKIMTAEEFSRGHKNLIGQTLNN